MLLTAFSGYFPPVKPIINQMFNDEPSEPGDVCMPVPAILLTYSISIHHVFNLTLKHYSNKHQPGQGRCGTELTVNCPS